MNTSQRDIDKELFFKETTLEGKIKFLLRYAILAPSTHNSQPWRFKVSGNSCKLYFDPEYFTRIKEADPTGRDLYISLGYCLEYLILAGTQFGIYRDVQIFPAESPSGIQAGRENLVAEVFFEDRFSDRNTALAADSALDLMVRRVNTRGLFEKKSVSPTTLQTLAAIAKPYEQIGFCTDMITDPEKIRSIADLTRRGLRLAYKNSAFRKEMFGWINNSFSKRREGLPGYALKMPALLSLIFPFIMRWFNIGAFLGKVNAASVTSAPLLCIISARDDAKEAWLSVGRLSAHLMLKATRAGLKTSIFVAAIEMGDLSKELRRILETDLTPQFLFAAGYLPDQKPTPRHHIEDRLVP